MADADVQSQGVESQAESDTAAASPDSTQTTQSTEETQSGSESTSTEEKTSQSVPYERFKEVNDQYKQAQARLDAIEKKMSESATPPDPQTLQVKQQLEQMLGEMGYVKKDQVEADLARREQDNALKQELSRLEKSYDGKDGRPKFDRQKVVDFALQNGFGNPEAAYKAMHEKELIDWHVRQASDAARGVKTEASDGSGSSQTSNDDLKAAVAKGDSNAKDLLLKRVTSSFFRK